MRRRATRIARVITLGAVVMPGSASATVPNDPAYPAQYGLQRISAPAAWDLTTGSSSIVVASVDDGLDPQLADLAPNLVPGYDFANRDSDSTQSESDHGSQTASLLAARGNDGFGMAGVSWSLALMPLKVRLDGPGERFDLIPPDAVAEAFRYAGARSIRVVNASFGLRSTTTAAELEAVRVAIVGAPATLFVVSAGNNARDNDISPRYPCNIDAPNLLCVAATDADDALWSGSNFGATSVDLGAPGAGVYVKTTRTNGPLDGTSYAAPLVSGAAALYLSRYPAATTEDVRHAILAGLDPVPALAGRTVSGGRLNLARTLTIAPAGTPVPSPPVAPQPSPPVASQPIISEAHVPRLRSVSRQDLRHVLRKGLQVRLSASVPTRVRVSLQLSPQRAKRLKIRRLLRSTTLRLDRGTTRVRLRLLTSPARRLRKQRGVAVRITMKTTGVPVRTRSETVVLT